MFLRTSYVAKSVPGFSAIAVGAGTGLVAVEAMKVFIDVFCRGLLLRDFPPRCGLVPVLHFEGEGGGKIPGIYLGGFTQYVARSRTASESQGLQIFEIRDFWTQFC